MTKYIIKKNGQIERVENPLIVPIDKENLLYQDFLRVQAETPELIEVETYSEDELLQQAKDAKIAELYAYDKSLEVFSYGDEDMWIDSNSRTALMGRRLLSEQRNGIENTKLSGVPMKTTDAIRLLDAVEIYAGKVYDATLEHEKAIQAKTTIKQVNSYNFKVNYPEKLIF